VCHGEINNTIPFISYQNRAQIFWWISLWIKKSLLLTKKQQQVHIKSLQYVYLTHPHKRINSFYVPLLYITHFTDSCAFSKSTWFCGRFKFCRRFRNITARTSLHGIHRDYVFTSLSSVKLSTHIWSHRDIKIPMYLWFWKCGRLYFFSWAKHIIGHFSGLFEGASTILIPKISLSPRQKKIIFIFEN
jgi:hypothetical protein